MIHVVTTVHVKPEYRVEFLNLFVAQLDAIRAEDGCHFYGPMLDIESGLETQPSVRSNTVTVLETWRDLNAIEVHMSAPHMLAFKSQAAKMVQDVSHRVLAPAD